MEDAPTNNDIIIEDVFNQPLVSSDSQPLQQYNHEYNHDHYHDQSANAHYQKEHKQAVHSHDHSEQDHFHQSHQHAGQEHLPYDHYQQPQEYEANKPHHYEQAHDHQAHSHEAYEQELLAAAEQGREQAEWNAYKTNTRTYFRPTPPSGFQAADPAEEGYI